MINSFRGRYLFLSNFYEGNVFEYKGMKFTNTEAAFHSQKCLKRQKDFEMMRPSQSKKLGRNVALRPDWEKVKEDIMYEVCMCKFTQDPVLKQKLIDTGDSYLEEGNHHNDKYWGTVNGRGRNRLGHILMKIREELK